MSSILHSHPMAAGWHTRLMTPELEVYVRPFPGPAAVANLNRNRQDTGLVKSGRELAQETLDGRLMMSRMS
jgi:hypothetical protein